MKKDELIKVAKFIEDFVIECDENQSCQRCDEARLHLKTLKDFIALEKAEEPVNESVIVPSDEEMLSFKRYVNEQHGSLNIDWLIDGYLKTDYHKSQVKTIDLREELIKFYEYLNPDSGIFSKIRVNDYLNSKQ